MKIAIVLAALLVAPLAPLSFASSAPAGCVEAAPAAAAIALLGEGATIASFDEVAGFPSALAMLPIVHPGARHRLLEAEPGVWCDAIRGFDAAWTIAGREGGALERASALASVAAARWMDGITIEAARELAPGVTTLTTHARTNGILATWTIVSDLTGIVSAKAVSTAIAVAPFEPQVEGFTALPGLAITFARGSEGLEVVSPSLAVPPRPQVTANAQYRASDGFTIFFCHVCVSSGYPNTTFRSGNENVDAIQWAREATAENYEEFLTWGLHKGWTQDRGTVSVDDATSLQCFACVFISQEFNIHISSQVVDILGAIAGTSFDDKRAALSDIIGHEMFHNFQNAYYKPGTFMEGAYIEGMARFQETLHAYSAVNHQPNSLVYAADANGCNEETANANVAPSRLAAGPSTDQSYSACNFWMSYYGTHGVSGIVAILEASLDHNEKSGWTEMKEMIEDAQNGPIAPDLAAFAHSLITGEGLVWGPASGVGPAVDWGLHLRRWSPAPLAPDESVSATVSDGGMIGMRATGAGTVAFGGAGVVGYAIRAGQAPAPLANGDAVAAGTYLVAIRPAAGAATATIALSPP